jgi:hypothetical protein
MELSCRSSHLQRILNGFFLAVALPVFLCARASPGPQKTGQQAFLEHSPVTAFNRGEILKILALFEGRVQWLRIFYKHEGLAEPQVRNLSKIGDNTYAYELETSEIPSLDFEYYLAAQTDGKTVYAPSGAPAEVYHVSGASQEPLPEMPPVVPPAAEKPKAAFPVDITGSVQTQFYEHEAQPLPKEVLGSGNARVFASYQKDQFTYSLESNFNYSNTPLEGDKDFDLSNLALSVAAKNHRVKAGDINVTESEYTVSGLGRRGIEYAFDNRKISAHVFDISSQQLKGFDGFGIPKSGVSIFGGAVGSRFLKDMFSLKAVYLAGKDSPRQGVNVQPAYFNSASRKGEVMAVIEETKLFKNRLVFGGEYARSKHDGNVSDDQAAQPDKAWRVGGTFSSGKFQIGANYRYIGQSFNPIGYPYFTNNRKYLEGNLGLSLGRVMISGSCVAGQDNVEDNPEADTTKNLNANASFVWSLSNKVSLNLGYRRDEQNTSREQGAVQFLQDSISNQLSGALNLNFSASASLNLQVTDADQKSQSFAQNQNSNLTVNFGGMFRAKDRLTFAPTLGYSLMKMVFTQEETRTYNAFFMTELALIPQVISVSMTGAFNRTDSAVQGVSNVLNISGFLSLYLKKLIKIGNVVLSVTGNYNQIEAPAFKNKNYAALAKCDFSF